MAETKRDLKKFVLDLSKIKGRHTELVSVYVPVGYDLNKIIKDLQQEQDTASNIKSKENRKRVQDSLERMIRRLRLFKKNPENGLAVFSGNASTNDSKVDIQVWSIEPPEPVQIRLYRCDQSFVLDPLQDMMEIKETYGLIVIDNREATVGTLRGTSVKMIQHLTSGVPGKTKAGGQSQTRYARIREIAAQEFYDRVGEIANRELESLEQLKGVIIGGPGPTKETFLDGDHLHTELKKKVLGIKDLSYTGEFGLQELVEKSKDLLVEQAITKERDLLVKFFETLAKDPNKASYGVENVKKSLEMGVVDTLMISEDLDEAIAESLEKIAVQYGSKVEYISVETQEGIQLKEIGGVGAILRYSVSQ